MLALKAADLLLPTFNFYGGWKSLFLFSIVLGTLNWLIKPILVFFSIPFLIVTIGLFYIVINALILYLASLILPGVLVATLGGIVLGSFLVSVFQWFLSAFFRARKKA